MTETKKSLPASRHHFDLNDGWLDQRREVAIDPDLPIIDPHHHLFERSELRYTLPDILDDVRAGHNVCATVFVECHTMYRTDGPPHLRPVGETGFINKIAAECAGRMDVPRIAAGIVAFADLRSGDRVRDVLEAHQAAAPERLRGIRQRGAWDESPEIGVLPPAPPAHLFNDPSFRTGFAHLADFDLVFDSWVFHPQLGELTALADAFPATPIVVNHAGGPVGIGPYSGRRSEVFAAWKDSLSGLAERPNIYVKLGGLGMKACGFGFAERDLAPSSSDLATAWRPYIETCIEMFGSSRCMFESNFPMDKGSCNYVTLWNAFKLMAQDCSAEEKAELFFRTAAKVYSLEMRV